jgi:hypothetical protein
MAGYDRPSPTALLIDYYARVAPTPAPLGKQYNEESEWSFKAMTKINEPNLQRRHFLTVCRHRPI